MKQGRVEDLRELVRDIEIAMLTTRTAQGHLVSRPMAVQKESAGADFWFVTSRETEKVRELEADPEVNLAFYKDRTREYVSVSGRAFVSDDRAKVRELWAPDWAMWFEDRGAPYDGSASDPRLLLIGVEAHTARFLTLDKPQIVVAFEYLKGMVTRTQPDLGQEREVSGSELRSARTRRAEGD